MLEQFSLVAGLVLSWLYELAFWEKKGKYKKTIFFLLSLVVGGTFAIINKEVALPAFSPSSLTWDTVPAIFTSLIAFLEYGIGILKYGVGVLLAGALFFATKVTKKTE